MTHESLVQALFARAQRQPKLAIEFALATRHAAETMALVSFHFYAMAIEAAARVDLGEMHTATLLATTALGAVENLQGCEYGLEIRSSAPTRSSAPARRKRRAHTSARSTTRTRSSTTSATRACASSSRSGRSSPLSFETDAVPARRPASTGSRGAVSSPAGPPNRMTTTATTRAPPRSP